MFFCYDELIKADGKFSVAWLMSFFHKKSVSRSIALSCSVSEICEELIKRCPSSSTTYSDVKKNFSLYLHGQLLYGAAILLARKHSYLQRDIEALYEKLKSEAFKNAMNTEINSRQPTPTPDLHLDEYLNELNKSWIRLGEGCYSYEPLANDIEIPSDFVAGESISVNAQTASDISLITDASLTLNPLDNFLDFSDVFQNNDLHHLPKIDEYQHQPDVLPPELQLSDPIRNRSIQSPNQIEPAVPFDFTDHTKNMEVQEVQQETLFDDSWQSLLNHASEDRKRKRETFSERMERNFKKKKIAVDTTTKLSDEVMAANIENYADTLVDRRVVIPDSSEPTVEELLQLVNPRWPKALHHLFRAVPRKQMNAAEIKKLFNTFPGWEERNIENLEDFDLEIQRGYCGLYEDSLYDDYAQPGRCDDVTRLSRTPSMEPFREPSYPLEELEGIRRKTRSSVFHQPFNSEIINEDDQCLVEGVEPHAGRLTILKKGKIVTEREEIYACILNGVSNALNELRFSALVPIERTNRDVAAKFFGSLLDLLGSKQIKAEQHKPYSEIFLSKRGASPQMYY